MSKNSNKYVILTDTLLIKQAQLCIEQTIDWYERMLTPFIANYQFNSKDIRFFLAKLAKWKVSSATVQTRKWK
jgi:hypothetical protein